jgi:protein-S-isoprenylcysteine O-methyltransferase Ste14
MDTAVRIHPVMRIPPPLMFVLTFLAGVGLQQLLPIPAPLAAVARLGHYAGFVLLGAGILLALTCAGLFFWSRTTIIPHRTASKMITWGPYRLTRNPMYVSLTLAFLGVAGILTQVWPLILLPIPLLVVHRVVIPFEESRMRTAFGDSFDEYCGEVRRWL